MLQASFSDQPEHISKLRWDGWRCGALPRNTIVMSKSLSLIFSRNMNPLIIYDAYVDEDVPEQHDARGRLAAHQTTDESH